MSDIFRMAAEFNRDIIGLVRPDRPTALTAERRKAIADHMREEAQELEDAEEIEDQIDALHDVGYIAAGRFYEMGVRPYGHLREVHSCNMKRVRGDNARRPGSVGFDAVKPEGWQEPDHTTILLYPDCYDEATDGEVLSGLTDWLIAREPNGSHYQFMTGNGVERRCVVIEHPGLLRQALDRKHMVMCHAQDVPGGVRFTTRSNGVETTLLHVPRVVQQTINLPVDTDEMFERIEREMSDAGLAGGGFSEEGSYTKPKIILVGHGRHGKDTVAEMLRDRYGYRFVSSSLFCAEKVMLPAFEAVGISYVGFVPPGEDQAVMTVEACYRDRHDSSEMAGDHRTFWFEAIKAYCTPDKGRLAREIFEEHDIYVGIRDRRELWAAKLTPGVLTVWVDASDRLPPEQASSMNIEPWMADVVLDNNGDLADLSRIVDAFFKAYF